MDRRARQQACASVSGFERKIKRKQARTKAKEAEQRLQQQTNMFDKIPSACMTCELPFNRKSKKDAQSFKVVVREKENKVNLYCNKCWDKAVDILQEFSKEQQEGLDTERQK